MFEPKIMHLTSSTHLTYLLSAWLMSFYTLDKVRCRKVHLIEDSKLKLPPDWMTDLFAIDWDNIRNFQNPLNNSNADLCFVTLDSFPVLQFDLHSTSRKYILKQSM